MLIDDDADIHEIVDPRDAAESAGLVYVTDDMPGISRHMVGKDFVYRNSKGADIADSKVVDRIRHLAIPPAYRDVWICPKANGHLQATGRDDRGRKQYRYHPGFREVRESVKFEHMTDFASVLPTIRATVKKHMGLRGLPREKVLATVVYLLETTLIRVGNAGYAKDNKSYGLTTLRDPHVEIVGSDLHFQFKGKSNKVWNLHVRDRRAAKIVHECQDLPGQHLFQYLDHDGEQHSVSSHDVNDYLHDITGHAITAKDFRTWAGTVLAALALNEFEAFDTQAHAKKNVRAAIEHVAARLGNTPTICRKCYIHPEVVKSYMSGDLRLQVKEEVEAELRDNLARLTSEEAAVLAMLEVRLEREVEEAKPKRTARATKRKPGSSTRRSRTPASHAAGWPRRTKLRKLHGSTEGVGLPPSTTQAIFSVRTDVSAVRPPRRRIGGASHTVEGFMSDFDRNGSIRWGAQAARAGAAEIDQGLRSYMLGVYNNMVLGLAITGLVALGVHMLAVAPAGEGVAVRGMHVALTQFGAALYLSPLRYVVMLAPLAFIFFFQFRVDRMSAASARNMFLAFSATMGLSLSSILLVYTGASVANAFFVTAATFGGLSLYGYTTRRNLSAMGSFLVMGLIGLVLASVVNLFVQSSAFQFGLSILSVLIFSGLTAWDTQAIKEMYYEGDGHELAAKKSVNGALMLYLDFINIFQSLLYLMGNRNN